MLQQTTLRSIAPAAPGHLACITFLNFVGSPPESLLALGGLLPHLVFKLFLSSLLRYWLELPRKKGVFSIDLPWSLPTAGAAGTGKNQ
jgi:hypothetical protein